MTVNEETAVNRNDLVNESGEERFGILLINFTSAEGLPEENFQGRLKNVDAIFSGDTEFGIAHIFWIFIPSVYFKTSNDLNVHIDSFYGWVVYHEDISVMGGFLRGISWEEV